jgi:hypothetical protein
MMETPEDASYNFSIRKHSFTATFVRFRSGNMRTHVSVLAGVLRHPRPTVHSTITGFPIDALIRSLLALFKTAPIQWMELHDFPIPAAYALPEQADGVFSGGHARVQAVPLSAYPCNIVMLRRCAFMSLPLHFVEKYPSCHASGSQESEGLYRKFPIPALTSRAFP